MKKAAICGALLALLAGNSYGETISGNFLFHSKDGKVVGIKAPAGLVALDDGPQMKLSGVLSLDKIKTCDEVEISFTRSEKRRVIDKVTFRKAAGSAVCDVSLKSLPLAQLNKAQADRSATLLDVRSPEEFNKAHLDGAINIPLGELEAKIPGLPKDKPLIVYCHSGRRAVFASQLLQEKGIASACVKGRFTVKDGKAQIME